MGKKKGLTRREQEVLRLVALGLTDRQIGDRLCISIRTATSHVANILLALDAKTRAHAVFLVYGKSQSNGA